MLTRWLAPWVGPPSAKISPPFPSPHGGHPCRPKWALSISQRIRSMGRAELAQRLRRMIYMPRVRLWARVFRLAAPPRRRPARFGGAPRQRAAGALVPMRRKRAFRASASPHFDGFCMHAHFGAEKSIYCRLVNCVS